MTTHKNVAPVIIKRKKIIVSGGHHGGAWKVAYADFVTAMMAFFMLMWLLNATTEQQRKGLADYFSPTFAINRTSGGGDSSFVGDSIFTEDTITRQGIVGATLFVEIGFCSRTACKTVLGRIAATRATAACLIRLPVLRV
jgi:chemotaxis protein MotB